MRLKTLLKFAKTHGIHVTTDGRVAIIEGIRTRNMSEAIAMVRDLVASKLKEKDVDSSPAIS